MNSKTKVEPKKNAAKTLDELFEHCLKDALWAENAMIETLPKMMENSSSKKLEVALKEHLAETKNQVKILKDIFNIIGIKEKEEKCEAMNGIIKEGEEILKGTEPGYVRDAGIISACQKAEHYEIASYGTMIKYASILKYNEVETLLSSILEEEKSADKKLSELSSTEIKK